MARCHTHSCAFPIEIWQVPGYAPAVGLYRSMAMAAAAPPRGHGGGLRALEGVVAMAVADINSAAGARTAALAHGL